MAKTSSAKDGKKMFLLFNIVFTLFILFSFVFDSFLSKGWWIRALENKWEDFRIYMPYYASAFLTSGSPSYTYWFGRVYNKEADPRISIAAIDGYTVKKYGYPFKRKYYAAVIEKLNKLGVKAIGLDVLFFDRDREDASSDKLFVDAVRKAGNISVLVAMDTESNSIVYPIPGLGEASRYISYPNVDYTLESNGQVRKINLFDPDITYEKLKVKSRCGKECEGLNLPLLAAATYSIYDKKPLNQLEEKYGQAAAYINFRIPASRPVHPGWPLKERTDKAGNPLASMNVYNYVSVADILENRLSQGEKDAVKGGIILLGSTALGAYDHYPSVFFPTWPGVEVHANAIDNLLHGDFIKPVGTMKVFFLSLFLIWLPFFLSRSSIKISSFIVAGIILALMVVNFILYFNLYTMAYLILVMSLLVPFLFMTVHKAIVEGREKKWIKNTFGQYLSPKVVEIITKDPSKLTLGGEKRDMTVFFLDIAGFTSMSEKLSPEQLTALLNKYLSGLTDVILKYDGVVDKFVGDCIMAFWNAPLDQKDHRRLAALAAVDCARELARLNGELDDTAIKLSFRIGLNSGPMIVGNLGSSTRFSYTVIGDSVNLASRLEGANKFFHSRILVSGYTYEGAADAVEARCLGQIRVVGKAISVKVYELLAHKGKLDAAQTRVLAAYNDGFAFFNKGAFAKAAKAFKTALAADPKDGPSAFYLDLAEKYAADGAPKEWDGTFNLASK